MVLIGSAIMKIQVIKCIILVSLALVSCALLVNLSVFGAVRPEAYVNRTHGYSMNPPSGWTVDESISGIVIFYGPLIPETGGRININIVVQTTTNTLQEYVTTSKSQLPTLFVNYNLVSEGSRNIGGLDGYELVATFTQAAYNFKNKQVFFVENGKAYIITFTALPTNYDVYLSNFEESLQTFELLAGAEFPWLILLILVVVVVVVVVLGLTIYFKTRKPKVEPTPPIPETPATTL